MTPSPVMLRNAGLAHGIRGHSVHHCLACGYVNLIPSPDDVSPCPVCNLAPHDPYKWDRRFLEMAEGISKFSKDPSTKTGAVIVDADRAIISTGFNGFARGVNDSPERYADRDTKYAMALHCEENAIVFADRLRLKGSTLYTWPFQSCAKCAGMVIQAGIKRCVAPPLPPDKAARWADNMKLAKEQFGEAGVQLDIVGFAIEQERDVA